MIFSTGQVLASVLTLASLVTASPVSLEKRGQNVILGYRVVDAVRTHLQPTTHSTILKSTLQAQAARYNSAGTVTDDANTSGVQLGKGAYTSPGPGEWAKVDPWSASPTPQTHHVLTSIQVLRDPRRLRRSESRLQSLGAQNLLGSNALVGHRGHSQQVY